jgi:formate/nitrite transporter FocA (FNT family)
MNIESFVAAVVVNIIVCTIFVVCIREEISKLYALIHDLHTRIIKLEEDE